MNQTLQRAVEQAQSLSEQRQNEMGEMLLALVEQDNSSLHLSSEQQVEIQRRIALPTQLVPEQEMQAFFNKLTK
jgi:hypothetical protein